MQLNLFATFGMSIKHLPFILQKVQASRRELVAYDRAQKEGGKKIAASPMCASSLSSSFEELPKTQGRCYGCTAATTEHCITLLRALAINPELRSGLCQNGLIQDLVEYNLRRGTVAVSLPTFLFSRRYFEFFY